MLSHYYIYFRQSTFEFIFNGCGFDFVLGQDQCFQMFVCFEDASDLF